MHKQTCSLVILSALLSISTYTQAEEPGFFEKRLYNPAYIYTCRTPRGNINIDTGKLTTLLIMTFNYSIGSKLSEHNRKSLLHMEDPSNPKPNLEFLLEPWNVYSLIITLPTLSILIYQLYKDWRGLIGDLVLESILNFMISNPTVSNSVWYAGRALYTKKILPFSYEDKNANKEESLEFAE